MVGKDKAAKTETTGSGRGSGRDAQKDYPTADNKEADGDTAKDAPTAEEEEAGEVSDSPSAEDTTDTIDFDKAFAAHARLQAEKNEAAQSAQPVERDWPTKPTPDYLIPGMGKLPVSSTVHFQSVVMTDMDGVGDQSAINAVRDKLHYSAMTSHLPKHPPWLFKLIKATITFSDGTDDVDVTSDVDDLEIRNQISFYFNATQFPILAGKVGCVLYLEYARYGIITKSSHQMGEEIELDFSLPLTPEVLRTHLFSPWPSSLSELADRISQTGLLVSNLDILSDAATMLEYLRDLAGPRQPGEPVRLDPLEDVSEDDMDILAEGVILHHEQGWYARGLALGNLLHSVALAPGEVTQIAVKNWNHATRSTDSESVSQSDTTGETGSQDRAVSEIQDAAVAEHQSGGSSANSSSSTKSSATSSTEADGSLSFWSAKAKISGSSTSSGSTNTVSNSVSHSDGSKHVGMQANQKIAAATERHAEAARTRRATVVREVVQSEDETLTTRVLANYNHMHSLTMMYFEVIEVFSLKTKVVDAERVVFLPYKVRDVIELIPKYRAVLVDAANDAGLIELADAIRDYDAAGKGPVDLDGKINLVKTRLGEPGVPGAAAKGGGAAVPAKPGTGMYAEIEALEAKVANLPDVYHDSKDKLDNLLVSQTGAYETALGNCANFSDISDPLGIMVAQGIQSQLQSQRLKIEDTTRKLEEVVAEEAHARQGLEQELAELKELVRRTKLQLAKLNESKRILDLLKPSSSGPMSDNRLYFNQAVWLSLSPGEILSMARTLGSFKGDSLLGNIDPNPVAITGNYVAYRWRNPDPAADRAFKAKFVEPYTGDPEQELATVQKDIAVPTGGVFGEAVLGEAVAAEKIDLSRFWNWKDSMIPILPTSINPLSATKTTMQNLSAQPMNLDESSAKLGQLQDLPAPSGFGALAATTQAQMFRDMSMQGTTQALAQATTEAAKSANKDAMETASKNLQAGLNFFSGMADKAISVAAAPETGGGSLLGSLTSSKDGGGSSLLGGVLNAKDAGGNGDVLAKLSGMAKGDVTTKIGEEVAQAAEGAVHEKGGKDAHTGKPKGAGEGPLPEDEVEEIDE